MDSNQLKQQHHPESIRRRLDAPPAPTLMPDAVLGGIDGCITTFAIISGALGAGFISSVAIVMGFTNLFADAFSMAISNYESRQVDMERVSALRNTEGAHIDQVPDGEREELRQIFSRKGFIGNTLEDIVETLSRDRSLWIDTMMSEEYGVQKQTVNSVKAAAVTFTSFLLIGSIPLLPFLVPSLHSNVQFALSALAAASIFFMIGFFKGRVFQQSGLNSGIKTLVTGTFASAIAFGTGYGLNTLLTG